MTFILEYFDQINLLKLIKSVENQLEDMKTINTQRTINQLIQEIQDRNSFVPNSTIPLESTVWKQKQIDYYTELQSTTDPIQLSDIKALESKVEQKQKLYRKIQISHQLPLDKKLLELKIKEKILELEELRKL